MAVLGGLLLVSDAKGALGGATFVPSRYGRQLRPRGRSSFARSPKQTRLRSDFANGSHDSRALTEPEVADWQTYVNANPKTQPISGAIYAPNPVNILAGLAVGYGIANNGDMSGFPKTAPTSGFAGSGVTITVVTSGVGLGLKVTSSGPTDPDGVLTIRLQRIASASRGRFIRKHVIRAVWGPLAGVDTTYVTDGTASGKKYSIVYNEINKTTGQQTPLVFVPGLVEAD